MSDNNIHDDVSAENPNAGDDIVRSLLLEIVRVKGVIKHYEALPNNEGYASAALLTELVAEAYNSLINYDLELMIRYQDLLSHSD